MPQRGWTTRAAFAIWITALALVFCNGACSVDSTAISQVILPNRDEFINKGVNTFMAQRCGALDCHGQTGRPLRLYSTNGLRKNLSPNKGRDTRELQLDELTDNYFSVVGLEPEEITTSMATQGQYTQFLLLLKPLSIEGGGVRHKGGPVLRSTDQGFDCLASWAAGSVNAANCQAGLIQ